MNGVKLLLIAAETAAICCLIMLELIPSTNVEPSTKAAFSLMFAISAVVIQSMQQDIKWKLD